MLSIQETWQAQIHYGWLIFRDFFCYRETSNSSTVEYIYIDIDIDISLTLNYDFITH